MIVGWPDFTDKHFSITVDFPKLKLGYRITFNNKNSDGDNRFYLFRELNGIQSVVCKDASLSEAKMLCSANFENVINNKLEELRYKLSYCKFSEAKEIG